MVEKTVCIGIPAYNEEKNIGNLLKDIINQNIDGFKVEKIYIISDCSTDDTDLIVKKYVKKNNIIKFERNKKRSGKSFILNKFFRKINSDILITLDADVRIKDENFIKKIVKTFEQDKNIGLVACNPIPFKTNKKNIAQNASFFSWVILDEIKRQNSQSLWCAHGRCLALNNKFYKNLKIPEILGDDQSIFLYCMTYRFNFFYNPDIKFYYFLPKKIKDYIKQSSRNRESIRLKYKIFGKKLIKEKTKIKFNLRYIFLPLKYPFNFFCWSILYTLSYFYKNKNFVVWDLAESTKGD